jgi:cell division protein FtsB
VLQRLRALSPARRLVAGAALLSLLLVGLSLADARGVSRLHKLQRDLARQEITNRQLREENAALAKTVKLLSPPVSDAALEKVAREQLGFVRPDEVIFHFE